jgi:hypothetical protein
LTQRRPFSGCRRMAQRHNAFQISQSTYLKAALLTSGLCDFSGCVRGTAAERGAESDDELVAASEEDLQLSEVD